MVQVRTASIDDLARATVPLLEDMSLRHVAGTVFASAALNRKSADMANLLDAAAVAATALMRTLHNPLDTGQQNSREIEQLTTAPTWGAKPECFQARTVWARERPTSAQFGDVERAKPGGVPPSRPPAPSSLQAQGVQWPAEEPLPSIQPREEGAAHHEETGRDKEEAAASSNTAATSAVADACSTVLEREILAVLGEDDSEDDGEEGEGESSDSDVVDMFVDDAALAALQQEYAAQGSTAPQGTSSDWSSDQKSANVVPIACVGEDEGTEGTPRTRSPAELVALAMPLAFLTSGYAHAGYRSVQVCFGPCYSLSICL